MPIKSNSLKPRTKCILLNMLDKYGTKYFSLEHFKGNYCSDFSINDKQNLIAQRYLVRAPLVQEYRVSRSKKLRTLLGDKYAQSN